MKRKDLIKLREKSQKELEKVVKEKKLELLKIGADLKANREKNFKKAKNLRHELAQVLTIIREKELMEEESSTGGASRSIKGKSARSVKESAARQTRQSRST